MESALQKLKLCRCLLGLVVALVVCFGQKVRAQPAYAGVDFYSLLLQHLSVSRLGVNQNLGARNIVPSISYAHYVGANMGVGIRFGKSFSLGSTSALAQDNTGTATLSTKAEQSEKLYYFSAFVFEDFHYKRFYFNLSLNIDYKYYYDVYMYVRRNYADNITSYEEYSGTTWPKISNIGLNFRPTIFYKIHKKIYAGAFLNMGLEVDYRTGADNNLDYLKRSDGSYDYYSNISQTYKNSVSFAMSDVRFGLSFIYYLKTKTK